MMMAMTIPTMIPVLTPERFRASALFVKYIQNSVYGWLDLYLPAFQDDSQVIRESIQDSLEYRATLEEGGPVRSMGYASPVS
jgi:hypothetical protein